MLIGMFSRPGQRLGPGWTVKRSIPGRVQIFRP